MGIDYTAVLGVGVDYDDITFETLTESALKVLQSWFRDSQGFHKLEGEFFDDELDYSDIPDDVYRKTLEDYFYEVCWGGDFLYDLGLTAMTGSYYSGEMDEVGVRISLGDLDNIQGEVTKAKEIFNKIINLEPSVFHGVLIS